MGQTSYPVLSQGVALRDYRSKKGNILRQTYLNPTRNINNYWKEVEANNALSTCRSLM